MMNPIYFKRSLSIFFGLFLFASSALVAQEPATSLDQLKLLLENGDKITVSDPSGKKMSGRVERITADTLDVRINGQIRSFKETDLRQITRKELDSPLNGFISGAAIGFGATLPFTLALASEDRNYGTAVVVSGLYGLIGGGIGTLVDLCVSQKHTVYLRPGSRASWSIRPLYSNSSKGVAVALHF